MPNDAKLGLVVGMGLVIAVAVVFFRKDAAADNPSADEVSAIRVRSAGQVPPYAAPRNTYRPVKARPTSRSTADDETAAGEQRHTVQEGDTLFALARRYYGDGDKFVEIYRANREVLQTPDQLPPGTVLVIPDLTAEN
jgi:nucleoid-associated protein YgaU